MIARYPELRTLAARMSEIASEIQEMGCFLKDIDQGLVDFPFLIEAEGDDEDESSSYAGNMESSASSLGIVSRQASGSGNHCRAHRSHC